MIVEDYDNDGEKEAFILVNKRRIKKINLNYGF